MVTSATFRKISAQKDRAGKMSDKERERTDASFIEKLCPPSSTTNSSNSKGNELKAVDLLFEESKTFDDQVSSLDGEETRAKTILDDIISCLQTCRNIVKNMRAHQHMSDVECISEVA